jgi:hypothetical protein
MRTDGGILNEQVEVSEGAQGICANAEAGK